MLLVAFGCVCVAFAVQLPWFFALGFTRGRPMIYIPVGIIAVIGFVAGQAGWLGQAGPLEVRAPSVLLATVVLVGGAVLLAASAVVAVRVYQRRELLSER
ncbi:hypothetical protein P9139_11255 [Curtobacterium flaccumfaciens]|nr:hypothetical protein P9139_11255 [Curtobacterium flaccumfaciens]